MKRPSALAAATICALIGSAMGTLADEQFKKLSGAQIYTKFIGMRLTDEVHWGEVYGPNGSLTAQDMGKKRVGVWRIQRDQLCTDLGKDFGSNCYEVWISGKKVQLRPSGSGPPIEGVLEKPVERN